MRGCQGRHNGVLQHEAIRDNCGGVPYTPSGVSNDCYAQRRLRTAKEKARLAVTLPLSQQLVAGPAGLCSLAVYNRGTQLVADIRTFCWDGLETIVEGHVVR